MDTIFSYEKKVEDDYYHIVGCDELSSVNQIIAEYKVRALGCHPDKNPNDAAAVERFAKLQRAKEVLCNEESRKEYDKWRRSGISMSYIDWCAKKGSVHTSMHWANKCKKEAMLEEGPSKKSGCEVNDQTSNRSISDTNFSSFGWKREESDILKKFRNYEI